MLIKFTGIRISYIVDKNVKPVKQRLRRIPAALVEKVDDELDRLIAANIIEKCDHSEWISPMTFAVKKDGSLRLCLDLRAVNKAIVREEYPFPTIDEMIFAMRGSKFFAVLDLEKAFHQVEITEESRRLSTFITHKGLYRYNRLVFGISSAPEIFQKIMETQILRDCEGVIIYVDDIVVYGQNEEEYNRRVTKVLKRFQEYDIKLNDKKCQFKLKEIDFMGFKIDNEGVKISEGKLEAVRKLTAPTNVSEAKSFIGFVLFMKKFIPNLSTIIEPITRLLKKDEKFVWEDEQRKAFSMIRKQLLSERTLGIFNPKETIELIADASPVGLGAILMQVDENLNRRIIAYASKTLSAVERRYAQTEKEALGLVWSVEHFHYYLYGNKFFLLTDHKPLLYIYGEKSQSSRRIERWVLRLQSYNFVIKYVKGSANIADIFSRLCQEGVSLTSYDEVSEFDIKHVMEVSLRSEPAITKEIIQRMTEEDECLKIVKEGILTGKFNKDLKRFELIKDQLSVVDGIILKGTKIVVPFVLRKKILELAHNTHGGENTLKGLLRPKVWWPGIDSDIKNYVEACTACSLNAIHNRREPMIRNELPKGPWRNIAVDFVGPVECYHVLTIIDCYSRYFNAIPMKNIETKSVIIVFAQIFGNFGYPEMITLDNGPQFNNVELKTFADSIGIKLNFTTPYSPWQNGLIERSNKTFKNFIKKVMTDGRSWIKELPEYILTVNSTINVTTGKTPGELFFRRQLRNKIPDISIFDQEDDVLDRDFEKKSLGKEQGDKDNKAKESEIETNDEVYAQRMNKNSKLESNFSPEVHKVIEKCGKDLVLKSNDTGKTSRRNAIHAKKVVPGFELSEQRMKRTIKKPDILDL